jgi:3-isopropylmalate/(R)-2-methylmalate dehydratase small subunit
MEPIDVIRSVAAALPRANVDTEVIIPITRLIANSRERLGPFCFEPLRYAADGAPDPAFPLNDPRFASARILVTGENFGCGSSREHAVWALKGMGFACVIAPSFGDIFRANCFQIGVLPITLDAGTVARLFTQIEAASHPVCEVDLTRCRITSPDGDRIAFSIDAERRIALLEGLDEIGLTRKHAADIEAFEARDRSDRPWVYQNIQRVV